MIIKNECFEQFGLQFKINHTIQEEIKFGVMNTFSKSKQAFMNNVGKDRSKRKTAKTQKVKSHIIFSGDPAFHEDSVEYVPITRRKKIFEDKESKILPPELMLREQDLIEHNDKLKNEGIINQQIIKSFDRQGEAIVCNDEAQQGFNKRKAFHPLKSQVYFEPNNLQTDLMFRTIPEWHQDNNNAINSSNASQTTQKKWSSMPGNNPSRIATLQRPPTNIVNESQANSQAGALMINFSYQGQNFKDSIIQSQSKSRIKDTNFSPGKCTSRTVFVNEGGVMGPGIKKSAIHESQYLDFKSNEQLGPYNYPVQDNLNRKGLVSSSNIISTPQFNVQNNREMKKADQICNNNDSSMLSYQSLPKNFNTDVNFNRQNSLQERSVHLNPVPISKDQQNLIAQMIKDQKNQVNDKSKKQPQQNSLSFNQEDMGSLFDKILNERQNIFNKGKTSEAYTKKQAIRPINVYRNSKIQTSANEAHEIHKPNDFITDSHSAPKLAKKPIRISSFAEKDLERSNIKEDDKQRLNSEKELSLAESKVKRIDFNRQEKTQSQLSKKFPQQGLTEMVKEIQPRNNKINKNNKLLSLTHLKPQVSLEHLHSSNVGDDEIEEASQTSQEDEIQQIQSDYVKEKPNRRKTQVQNDQQLEEFLKNQKEEIHVKQARKYIQNLPEVQKYLKSKEKKQKKQSSKMEEQSKKANNGLKMQQPVLCANIKSLTPEQMNLLSYVGLKLIDTNQVNPYSQSFQNNNLQSQSGYRNAAERGTPNLVNQLFANTNSQFFQGNLSGENSKLSKEKSIRSNVQQINFHAQKMSMNNNTISYYVNADEFEKKFQQITKALYKQLCKFQPQPYQNSVNNLHNPFTAQKQNKQTIDSAISFKKTAGFQPQNLSGQQKSPNYQQKPRQNYLISQDKDTPENSELYSRQIYRQLKRFNSKENINRKSEEKQVGESPNDETQYYSFYHDQNYPKNDSNQGRINLQRYYPKRSGEKGQKFKSKFDIKSKIHNPELQILYSKIQLLSKQIHEELPSIRKQIQQNQQQIRKIETNLLIQNTVEQHNLIKMVQKMKLKDLQLKHKEAEIHKRDQELSMYQNELNGLRCQFFPTNQQNRARAQTQFFKERLGKIKTYNQKLCQQITHAKSSPRYSKV